MPSVLPGHLGSDNASSPLVPNMFPDGVPSGVPPPSLNVFPLMNPSTHFAYDANKIDDRHSPRNNSIDPLSYGHTLSKRAEDDDSRVALTTCYLYFDDEGYTRWQGEASGLPVLDLLVERHAPSASVEQRNHHLDPATAKMESAANPEWFPNRQPRRSDINPQVFWRLITSYIPPKLMDRYDHGSNVRFSLTKLRF